MYVDDLFFYFHLILHSCYDLGQFLIVRPLKNAPSNGDLTGDLDYNCSVVGFLSFFLVLDRKEQEPNTCSLVKPNLRQARDKSTSIRFLGSNHPLILNAFSLVILSVTGYFVTTVIISKPSKLLLLLLLMPLKMLMC